MKQYKLIVSANNFSLICPAEQDSMTDYFPGIWAIKTQKSALYFAKDELTKGNDVIVDCYNEPRNFPLANKMIKALGLKQPLFAEVAPVVSSVVTNGKPSTLGALKKYLQVGVKVRIKNYDSGTGAMRGERDTFVKKLQTTSVVFDKNGGNSWLEFGKAGDWSFDNDGANSYWIDRDGKRILMTRIEYK